MSSIKESHNVEWMNHHLSIGSPRSLPDPTPSLLIKNLYEFVPSNGSVGDGIAHFKDTAATLMSYLSRVMKPAMMLSSDKDRPRHACGMTGTAWSFAPLIGTEECQLDLSKLTGCAKLENDDFHPLSKMKKGRIALTSGGTRLREIANWAKANKMMVSNSGTHLGATIAGVAGTASHGSRLGEGGVQDMIRGMHIVTGDKENYWIEPRSRPVLSDKAIKRMGAKAIRDDAIFADCLIHLGCMGIVNGVAIELVKLETFYEARIAHDIDNAWAERVAEGDFQEIADSLLASYAPEYVGKKVAFYEVTFNPHLITDDDPKTINCVHILYLEADEKSPIEQLENKVVRTCDALVGFFKELYDDDSFFETWSQNLPDGPAALNAAAPPQNLPPELSLSGFEYYKMTGGFTEKKPDGPLAPKDWSQLHGDVITTGQAGALYNASFAIDRCNLPRALSVISGVIQNLRPYFVFTARFIDNPAGTLAFTRFKENAIIEIDGLSPWFFKGLIMKRGEQYPILYTLEKELTNLLENGAMAVRAGLESAGIDYSMHWAKLGNLDAKKVKRDFGIASSGNSGSSGKSPIARWQATREKLLTPAARDIFWNEAVRKYGLLDKVDGKPPVTNPPSYSSSAP